MKRVDYPASSLRYIFRRFVWSPVLTSLARKPSNVFRMWFECFSNPELNLDKAKGYLGKPLDWKLFNDRSLSFKNKRARNVFLHFVKNIGSNGDGELSIYRGNKRGCEIVARYDCFVIVNSRFYFILLFLFIYYYYTGIS